MQKVKIHDRDTKKMRTLSAFLILLCMEGSSALAAPSSSSVQTEKKSLRTQKIAAVTTSLGFLAVTADTFANKGVLMPHMDELAREAAKGRYENPAGRSLSNVAPALACITGIACAATSAPRGRGEHASNLDRRRVFAVAGSWALMQPSIVGLKYFFKRQRPDPAHHFDPAFPSGHTANAAFLSGALAFLLVPSLLDKKQSGIGLPMAFTALGTISVAAGRLLTEAHWLSDTLAGACIGLFFCNAAVVLATRETVLPPEEF